ncbi:glycosyltransferase family protein [Tepidamorphus sp. 3E244]|uniref:glycosyltransferase family protein n=1 Tax=Tepidamorphus sp. 3E244 TaxID=3385498 RepID=UPI0038FC97BD
MTRVLFYVQHLLGIGHVYRARRVCDAIHASGLELTLVTGGLPVKVLENLPYDVVQLPPLRTSGTDFAGLVDADGNPADEAYMQGRRAQLLELAESLRPDIAITEAYPFGRRQMRHELRPFLETLRENGAKLLCSVRDILQQNRKPGRDAEARDLLNALYDGVLVHGDPRIASLADTFPLADEISIPVHHTGMVAPPVSPPSARDKRVVVSAGGGVVGGKLLQAASAAASDPRMAAHEFVLSTGPNLPENERAALLAASPANVKVVSFVDDLPGMLAASEVSVSQAGYNTVADILVADTPCVLVPFATDGETEQTFRAQALSRLERAVHLPEVDVTASSLAEAITRAAQLRHRAISMSLDGAAKTASLLKNMH